MVECGKIFLTSSYLNPMRLNPKQCTCIGRGVQKEPHVHIHVYTVYTAGILTWPGFSHINLLKLQYAPKPPMPVLVLLLATGCSYIATSFVNITYVTITASISI